MSRKGLIIILALGLFAVFAMVLASFAYMNWADRQLPDVEPRVLHQVGGIESQTIEGVVSSLGHQTICLDVDGERIGFYFDNLSVKYQLKEISVGDAVRVQFFDADDFDPCCYLAYSIEKKYADPRISIMQMAQ